VAAYNVPRGQIAVHDKSLVASTADTVTFTDEAGSVEVWTDGTAAVFVSTDGSPATVNGGDCYEIEPGTVGGSSRILPVGGRSVSLISTGTPKYSVTRTA
jgi:hypothetical protein